MGYQTQVLDTDLEVFVTDITLLIQYTLSEMEKSEYWFVQEPSGVGNLRDWSAGPKKSQAFKMVQAQLLAYLL